MIHIVYVLYILYIVYVVVYIVYIVLILHTHTRHHYQTQQKETGEPCKFGVSGDRLFRGSAGPENRIQPSASAFALRIYKSKWRGWWLNLGVNSALLCGFARKNSSACAFCTLHQDRGVGVIPGRPVFENFVGKCTIFDGFSVKMCQKLVYFGKFDPGLSKNMKKYPIFTHF